MSLLLYIKGVFQVEPKTYNVTFVLNSEKMEEKPEQSLNKRHKQALRMIIRTVKNLDLLVPNEKPNKHMTTF